MTNATAKYILTAEDKTQNAINSAKRSFKELNDSARSTGRGISTLTQLFVGAGIISGIRQFTNAVVSAAAASDKDFAAALKSVDTQMQKLLTPTSGLPAATAATKELAETLKNPELIAAADNLTSHVITAWAKLRNFAAEAVAGWNLILNGPSQRSMQIDDRLRALQDERRRIMQSAGVSDPSQLAGRADMAKAYGRILEIDQKLAAGSKEYQAALATEAAAARAAAAAEAEHAAAIQKANDYKAWAIRLKYQHGRAMNELEENGKWLDEYSKKVDDATSAIIHFEREIEQGALGAIEDFNNELEKAIGKEADEWDKAQAKAKDSTDKMSVYAEQAARNMQDSFAEFLFDPFKDGLGGMVSGFIDAIRRMVAEAAAAKVFDFLKGKSASGGLLGFLGSLLGGARADGGPVSAGTSYLVGERGPEIFTPSSSGAIAANGSMGGNVNVNYNIDARGATTDLISALPGILRQHGDALKADLLDGIRRRRYAI